MKCARASVIAWTAVVLACCGIPGMDGIRRAVDKGDPAEAMKIAGDSGPALDFVAMEILRAGAADPGTKDAALASIRAARPRMKPFLDDLARNAECPIVKATAQASLFRMNVTTYEDDLVAGLDSDLGSVRAAAVGALVRVDQTRGFHEHYILDTDPDVRMAVVAWLASHDLPWSGDLLVERAAKDPDPAVRLAAIGGLSPEDDASREVLKAAISGSDGAGRMAAAEALGGSVASVGLTWAEHLLVAPVTAEGIRFAAALATSAAAVKPKGKSAKAKAAAADAALAAGRAAEYLSEAIRDESPTVRLDAIGVIASRGLQVDGIDDLASDPSPDVRVAWCRLTRKLGTSEESKRIEMLEEIALAGPTGERDALPAMLALAEEEGGYARVRSRVWWILPGGDASTQRWVLAHAVRPFGDPSLALWCMKLEDPGVRVSAASAWLSRP